MMAQPQIRRPEKYFVINNHFLNAWSSYINFSCIRDDYAATAAAHIGRLWVWLVIHRSLCIVWVRWWWRVTNTVHWHRRNNDSGVDGSHDYKFMPQNITETRRRWWLNKRGAQIMHVLCAVALCRLEIIKYIRKYPATEVSSYQPTPSSSK